jgi:hypothetical protein
VLGEWLGELTLAEFSSGVLGRQAWARPGAALGPSAAFGWDALGRLLERPALDLIVIARGQLLEVEPPRSLADARALLAADAGFVVRRAERHDRDLARLAADVSRDLPGAAHVQIFVTPARSYGFAWHYDAEEVFIVQTAGVKDYYFRANTVTREPPRSVRHDFGCFRQETSPLQTARLVPGDVLYLPAGWWHRAQCVEESLSISLGLRPLAADRA